MNISESLQSQLLQLTPSERASLVVTLIRSLDDNDQPTSWEVEIGLRLAAYREAPENVRSQAQVLHNLKNRRK